MPVVATPMRRSLAAGLSPRRQLLGGLLGIVGLPLLTVCLLPFRDDLPVESVLLLNLLVVVAVAAVGGIWPAIASAVTAVGIVNWFFTPPYHALAIDDGNHVLALAVFLVVAAVVALYVTVADRSASESAAVRAEAAALDRANELRTGLLRAVSHDLRTPLASIKAAASSLRADDVTWSPEATEEFLAAIEDDADRLNHLVGNLLDMGRIQAGSVELTRRPVGLDEIVALALAGLDQRAERVEVDVPEDLPFALADPGLLERAVANVIDNAVNWSPPGEIVRVTARLSPPDLELRVTDRGPGIPPSARDAVFQPFQQLGDQGASGVGLGLAIARGFLQAMGGEIHVEDAPSGGAAFVLLLPIATP